MRSSYVRSIISTVSLALLLSNSPITFLAAQAQPQANTLEIPTQILKSGVNLSATTLSPNSSQLADQIGLMPVLSRIQQLKDSLANSRNDHTLENLELRTSLQESINEARGILLQSALEVDYVVAEINAERDVYSEILSSFTSSRDKLVAKANAASFMTNGFLWAVCEALAIPTNHHSNYAIQSGIMGIIAGMVPSVASGYAMYAYGGRHKKSEADPNMLAKLFNYPTTNEVDYPNSVWLFLNSAPASEKGSRTRKEQLVDRWIADSNMPGFTDRNSKKQLDTLTASVPVRRGLSIDTLSSRMTMLTQLGSEVDKMKRLLLELSMAVNGVKKV